MAIRPTGHTGPAGHARVDPSGLLAHEGNAETEKRIGTESRPGGIRTPFGRKRNFGTRSRRKRPLHGIAPAVAPRLHPRLAPQAAVFRSFSGFPPALSAILPRLFFSNGTRVPPFAPAFVPYRVRNAAEPRCRCGSEEFRHVLSSPVFHDNDTKRSPSLHRRKETSDDRRIFRPTTGPKRHPARFAASSFFPPEQSERTSPPNGNSLFRNGFARERSRKQPHPFGFGRMRTATP